MCIAVVLYGIVFIHHISRYCGLKDDLVQ